mgnify:CR=1 FL=1
MLNLSKFETVHLGMSVSLAVIGYLGLTSFMSFRQDWKCSYSALFRRSCKHRFVALLGELDPFIRSFLPDSLLERTLRQTNYVASKQGPLTLYGTVATETNY